MRLFWIKVHVVWTRVPDFLDQGALGLDQGARLLDQRAFGLDQGARFLDQGAFGLDQM